MKPVDVKSSTYFEFGVENNDKDLGFLSLFSIQKSKYLLEFKVLDCLWKSKFENIIANSCTLNWSGKVFVIMSWNIILWTYVTEDLNDEEIVGTFYEKQLQKTNQQKIRVKKVIKIKS